MTNIHEPIKHHYIPRFLLKPFCFDETHLYYCDKSTFVVSIKDIRDVFVTRNLYRDEINNAEEPTKIEKDLAIFEGEVSRIIKEKFLICKDITISIEEDEKLKLFFAVMGFRANTTSRKFGEDASEESKGFYSLYQDNSDLTDFWKRNLGIIVNCRSLKEVIDHSDIDDPIKVFFTRDTYGYSGTYFVVLERRGSEEFIISDSYPTVINGVIDCGLELRMYLVFPVSPNRVVLLANNGVEGAPQSVSGFSKEVFRRPKLSADRRSIMIHVNKIYEHEVRGLNAVMIKETREGFVFENPSGVTIPSLAETTE